MEIILGIIKLHYVGEISATVNWFLYPLPSNNSFKKGRFYLFYLINCQETRLYEYIELAQWHPDISLKPHTNNNMNNIMEREIYLLCKASAAISSVYHMCRKLFSTYKYSRTDVFHFLVPLENKILCQLLVMKSPY